MVIICIYMVIIIYIYTMEYHIQVLWIKFERLCSQSSLSQPMTTLSAPKNILIESMDQLNGPCDMQKAAH